EGEVVSSLVGPFVGFHHQALLISALWPEGRGNVSYGACVGSNHTSRAPDQEALLGEGTFLGLGVNVKYPLDLSRSPYSVVACGVTLAPQRVAFPFALINAPAAHRPEVPPSLNELVPGWVLAQNLYALKRTEWKHRVRNRARRSTFAFEVFRPATVELMRDACRRLAEVPQPREVYTGRDLDGLGKNFLTEPHRQQALRTYRFFIPSYALLGLFEQGRAAVAAGAGEECGRLLAAPGADPDWEHRRLLLAHELEVREVTAGLRELPEMLNQVAHEVERSKARDDERGRQVIADYAEMHPPATSDPFIQQIWTETRRLQRQVSELLVFL